MSWEYDGPENPVCPLPDRRQPPVIYLTDILAGILMAGFVAAMVVSSM